MLTPQEVSDKKFKQAFMGGYDMATVDTFLEALTEDYTALYKENAVLKSKIRVLVEKLEEYRSVDDSMRKALLSAQRMAEKTTQEAQSKADSLMRTARIESEKALSSLSEKIALEAERLDAARVQTLQFVNGVRDLYQRQLDVLARIPQMDRPEQSPREKREEATVQAAAEIAQSVEMIVEAPEAPPEQYETESENDTRIYKPQDEAKAEPPVDNRTPEQLAAIAADERIRSFEVVFGADAPAGDDRSDIWEPENDTEVPPPRYDHPDLDSHFGHSQAADNRKNRKR